MVYYATCPNCGRRLCRGEAGTKVEMECPKCNHRVEIVIECDRISICNKVQTAKIPSADPA